MNIIIREISGRTGLREFIHLPGKIHEKGSFFIPPLYTDEFKFHDPKENSSLCNSDVVRFLAYQDGTPVGRIMGIIYHQWNTQQNRKDARFFQFDCIDDLDVAQSLLNAAEDWARQKGMNLMIGPFGFSDKDPQGLQIEGFEHDPVIAAVVNEPYVPELLSKSGYEKFKDCISYNMTIPERLPEVYYKAAERLKSREKLRMVTFPDRNALKPWFIPVMQLMNNAYKNIYGFMPLDDEAIRKLAKQYLPLLDPRLVKLVADQHDRPVAFIIAMPNISEGFRKAGGRLFPFGFIYLLRALKKSKRLDLLLGGIDEHYKGRGLNVLLGIEIFGEARRMGIPSLDSHLILEENRLMRSEMEKLGGRIYKRYRIYCKAL